MAIIEIAQKFLTESREFESAEALAQAIADEANKNKDTTEEVVCGNGEADDSKNTK